MANERELTTGLLSKDANFRLIVSGPVGVKEIERLIQKLQLDKEILADQSKMTRPPTEAAYCMGNDLGLGVFVSCMATAIHSRAMSRS